ncbi:MAG: hypothetical protein K2P03_06785, partial [Lachnospiraceae bacterium]|nr:hypothetical protein [Lachnospiraceae bacterium]
MRLTKKTQNVMDCAVRLAREHHHRYFMPEHMIYGITFDEDFCREYQAGGGNVEKLRQDIWNFLKEQAGTSEAQEGQQTTLDAQEVFEMAELQAHSSGRDAIEVSHLLSSILELSESYGVYYMKVQDVDLVEVLGEMSRESLSRERGEELGRRTPEPAYGEDTPEG